MQQMHPRREYILLIGEYSPVKQTESKIAAVSVGTEGHARQCAQVVHPIQLRRVRCNVVAAKQQIDRIWAT